MELNLDWQTHTSSLWPEVRYDIRPLRVWAFQELLRFWETHTAAHPDQPLTSAETMGLMAVARRVLPDHLQNLTGITLLQAGSRQPASIESLCEETALAELTGEIITRLVALSAVRPEQEKN
ncbi:MAG: hypothetical protein OEV94_01805 [Deltaproteobacteria bacterium]|nr:hypothetical protein [Deltaproteobacteria bacterium]